MTGLLQKLKNWRDKIKTTKMSYKVSGIRPVHDWRVLLITTQIILVLLAALAFYFYIQIDEGKLFLVPEGKTEKELKIDNVLLKKAVDDINLRETTLSGIKQSKDIPSDPSL